MPNCTATSATFPPIKRRLIDFDFSGGCVTANSGVMLLRSMDQQMMLTQAVAHILPDSREPGKVEHSTLQLLRQRVYALACGKEDLIDHTSLRHDMALQSAVNSTRTLASTSTLQRFEQGLDRYALKAAHEVLVQQFIASYPQPPKEITLDFDATDNRLFGDQEGAHYLHHYRHYCYLPLYVFCGDHLLTAVLRPSSKGGSWLSLLVLRCLVNRLRRAWPDTKIIYRGDSGFYHPKIISWCEGSKVDYLVGFSVNSTLKSHPSVIALQQDAEKQFQQSSEPQKQFVDFEDYKARSWPQPRRLVAKAEVSELGKNLRFVLTSLTHDAKEIYSERYCMRGDMENRIKEQKWLFSDRNSCRDWWPNQFRVLLSGLAYTLLEGLRRLALKDTQARFWQVRKLRESLLNIPALVTRNTRRIKLRASSTVQPEIQALFNQASQRLVLAPG